MSQEMSAQVEQIVNAACRGDTARMAALLDTCATSHAGTPPQKVKDRVVLLTRKRLGGDDPALVTLAQSLVTSDSPGAREVGIMLIWPFVRRYPDAVYGAMARVGDDANWEVREWAASALAHVIVDAFDDSLPWLSRWVTWASPAIRRMVAVAAGYTMRDVPEHACVMLFDILTPLMADTDAYVSKNLGPFALGSYAVRYRPETTARWALSLDRSNEVVAITLARMFTTAAAAQQIHVLEPVLASLLADVRPRVQREVHEAQRALQKRGT